MIDPLFSALPAESTPEACAPTDAAPTTPLASIPFCGVAAAAALLGDAWTLLLVRDLAHGPRRFTELQTSTGISVRVLTDRLRMMALHGLVTRNMFNEIPPRVEYTLTERGLDVLPVLDALRTFGETWLRPERG